MSTKYHSAIAEYINLFVVLDEHHELLTLTTKSRTFYLTLKGYVVDLFCINPFFRINACHSVQKNYNTTNILMIYALPTLDWEKRMRAYQNVFYWRIHEKLGVKRNARKSLSVCFCGRNILYYWRHCQRIALRFSLVDAKKGYGHVPLDKSRSYHTTSNTPHGQKSKAVW
jgi:hypothetical protein